MQFWQSSSSGRSGKDSEGSLPAPGHPHTIYHQPFKPRTVNYYYLNADNKPVGPHSLEELANLKAVQVLDDHSLVAARGAPEWTSLSDLLGSTLQENRRTGVLHRRESAGTGVTPPVWHLTVGMQVAIIFMGYVMQLTGEPGLFDLVMIVIMSLGALVLMFYVHYVCWSSIPRQFRTMSPGLAVFLLLIPVFHWFWIFFSLFHLVKGLEAWERSKGIRSDPRLRHLSIALAVAWALQLSIGMATGFSEQVTVGGFLIDTFLEWSIVILGYFMYSPLIRRIRRLLGNPDQNYQAAR